MADRTVSVRFQAIVGPFQAEMLKASQSVKGVTADLATFSQKNQAMAKQAGVAGVAVGGALALGLGQAVKAAMGFDQVISNVGSVAGATGKQLGQLRQAALDAGKATVFSASESAQAEAELAKAGVSVSDILGGALTGSLNLAAAGQIGVADAASIAATAMVQFGKSGADVPHIADLLAASANKAQGGVDDMAQALQYVGPVASQMGVSIEETAGTIALLAQNGQLGERAGTGLRGMLTALTSPSAMASKEMAQLGINVYDATGDFVGFNGVAQQLHGAMSNLTNAERDQALGRIFGNEQITVARVLYAGGAEAVDKWTKSVNDAGAAGRIAGQNMDNLAGDLEQLRGSIETALIEGGTEATGALRFLAQAATETVNLFADLPGPMQGVVLGLTTLTAGATLLGGAAIIAVPKIQAFNLALMEMATAPGASAATTASLSALSVGVSSLGTALAAATGLAAAFGVAALAMNLFADDSSKTKVNVDELTQAIKAQSDTLGDSLKVWAAHAIVDNGIDAMAKRAHIGLGVVSEAVLGNAAAMDQLKQQSLGLQELANGGSAADQKRAAAAAELLQKVRVLSEQYGAEQDAALRVTQVQNALGIATEDTSDKVATATGQVQSYTDQLATLYDKTFGVQDASEKMTGALAEFADGVRAAQINGDAMATSLDDSTEAGLRNREALRGIVQQAFDVADAMQAQGASTEQIAATMDGYRSMLVAVLQQLGFNQGAAQQYVDVLLQVPGQVSTTVNLDTAAAQAKLAALYAALGNLDFNLRAIGERVITTGSSAIPSAIVLPKGISDALAGRGSQATSARQSAAKSGGGAAKKAADDAKQALEERKRLEEQVNQYLKDVYQRRQDALDVAYTEGRISLDAYIKALTERHDRLVAIYGYDSKEAKAVRDEVRQVRQDVEAEARKIAETASDAAKDAAKTAEDRLSKLNSLLDDERDLRNQLVDAAEQHRKKMAEIDAGRTADMEAALKDREQSLLGWARLDQRAQFNVASSVGAISKNIRQQVEDLTDWASRLDALRARGLSDAVISMLGLDEGPQSLAQLRQFGKATDAELADLNAAVSARQKQATDRVTVEQGQTYSKLSATLAGITSKYAAEVEAEAEAFLSDQRKLNDQLAALGQAGGRSWAEAIAAGIASGIPAIRAAAEAARQAQQLANQAAQTSVSVSGSAKVNVPDGHGGVVEVRADQLGFFGAKPNADGSWSVPAGSVRSFDVGTASIRGDGLAMVHDGERIIPENLNRLLPADLSNQHLVSAVGGGGIDYDRLAAALSKTVTGGRGVEFSGPIVLRDGVDVDLLARRLSFAGGFG